MEMVGRNFVEGKAYRQGYNGKENDKDFGEGVQDYGFRIYDKDICRFLSEDPLKASFPWNSVYAFAENDVISCVDLDGGEKRRYNKKTGEFEIENGLDRGTQTKPLPIDPPKPIQKVVNHKKVYLY
jgi:RHS repeat-associated protein